MTRTCHFQIEYETKGIKIKSVMKNSFLSKNREPKCSTQWGSFSHKYIYTYIYQSVNPIKETIQ